MANVGLTEGTAITRYMKEIQSDVNDICTYADTKSEEKVVSVLWNVMLEQQGGPEESECECCKECSVSTIEGWLVAIFGVP